MHAFNQMHVAIFDWILVNTCDEQEEQGEKEVMLCFIDEKHLAVKQSRLFRASKSDQIWESIFQWVKKVTTFSIKHSHCPHSQSHGCFFFQAFYRWPFSPLSRGQRNQWACQEHGEHYLPVHQVQMCVPIHLPTHCKSAQHVEASADGHLAVSISFSSCNKAYIHVHTPTWPKNANICQAPVDMIRKR